MRSSFRVPTCAASVLFVLVAIGNPEIAAADPVPEVGVRCQRAIAKAGAAFATRTLGDLGRCVVSVLACIEKTPGDDGCLREAGGRCVRTLGKIDRREAAVVRALEQRCANIDPNVLREPSGLGFVAFADECPVLGTYRADGGAIGVCMARRLRCRAERLLAAALPRAGELLRIAGVPEGLRNDLACLPDRGGSGASMSDSGPAVARCARTLQRAAARFGERTLASVAVCTKAAFPCLDGAGGDASCIGAATPACERAIARIGGARRALSAALRAACGDARVPFDDLADAGGVSLEVLTDDCAAVSVDPVEALPAHATCLGRLYDCEVATIARDAIPRVDEMLGLVGQAIGSPLCPIPEPTATATPPPTPTVTVTGPTRTPRPGETPTVTPTPAPTSTRTATPRPTPKPVCGNGIAEEPEECDTDDLGDSDATDCDFFCDEASETGVLRCGTDCRYDFTQCRGEGCTSE